MTSKPPKELLGNIAAVSAEYGADLYFYSGPIDDSGLGQITTSIGQAKDRDKALLILTTSGGQANAAYHIARLFQKMYEEFILFTPSYCKSAGTIIALGAHKLIMDSFSELGPLDVQLFKQNEIMARKSGLLSRSSFDSLAEVAFDLYEHFMLKITLQSDGLVSFKLASELSATMTSNLLAPIYGQINPDVVGSDWRDLSVALHYGMRLVEKSKNASVGTVLNLVHDYPSHDFIIDDDEAKNLFNNIEPPTENLYHLIGGLGESAYNEQQIPRVCALTIRVAEHEDEKSDKGKEEKPSAGDERAGTVDDHRDHDRAGNRVARGEEGASNAPDDDSTRSATDASSRGVTDRSRRPPSIRKVKG